MRQHPDPRVHQEVPAFRGADQTMNGRLPFGPVLFGLWQLRDVVGSIFRVTSFRPPGSGMGFSNGVDQGNALLKQ